VGFAHHKNTARIFWTSPTLHRKKSKLSDYIQVITTTATHDEAEIIARALVEEHLAACTQIIGPITSIYRWEGQIETSQEYQCWAKSRRSLYERLEAAIRRLHPYQVPEILAVPIVAGSETYLKWLDDEVS
jgi:periplasmic divalent cation tolerance protein